MKCWMGRWAPSSSQPPDPNALSPCTTEAARQLQLRLQELARRLPLGRTQQPVRPSSRTPSLLSPVPHLRPLLRAPVPAFQLHLLVLDPTILRTSDVQLAAPHPILPCIFPFLRKESRGGPSRRGVALLRPEPLHRGTADTLLNRVKKLPCQITRCEVVGRRGQRGRGSRGGQGHGVRALGELLHCKVAVTCGPSAVVPCAVYYLWQSRFHLRSCEEERLREGESLLVVKAELGFLHSSV